MIVAFGNIESDVEDASLSYATAAGQKPDTAGIGLKNCSTVSVNFVQCASKHAANTAAGPGASLPSGNASY
jgi:hypothetical protein